MSTWFEHTPQRVPRLFGGDAVFHRLADRDAEASRVVRVAFRNPLPAAVSGLGLGTHFAPHVSINMRRYGFWL